MAPRTASPPGSMPDETTADPLERRSAVLYWLFGWYLRWFMWRRFHALRLSRTGLPILPPVLPPVLPPGRPLIVYSNHPSWFDPAFFILLATRLMPGRAGFGPIDAQSLRRYGLLARMGAFGIDLDTPRGAARFLGTSLRILENPAHMLWITAEGGFTDPRRRPVRLRPGLAHLARRIPGAVILPLAVEYVFWNESRPEALARFGPPIQADANPTIPEWTATLEAALTETMDALAAESARRDPTLFQRLQSGRTGVGGIYDAWRRLRAWASGHRFDPSHEGPE